MVQPKNQNNNINNNNDDRILQKKKKWQRNTKPSVEGRTDEV